MEEENRRRLSLTALEGSSSSTKPPRGSTPSIACLPPELYSAITSYSNLYDLLTLARTSKAFQRAAEARIYEFPNLRDAQTAFHCCHSLLTRGAFRAPYVRRFMIYQDPRRAFPRMNFATASTQFWSTVQAALSKADNLELLILYDPRGAHSWVLDHPDARFQLRELNTNLPWDAHTVALLAHQHKLRVLTTGDSLEDGPPCALPPGALGSLTTFSGPVLVAAELLASPLTHLQIVADDDTAPLLQTVVSDLARLVPTLRGLNILGANEALMLEALQAVAQAVFAPKLRYFGVLVVLPAELPAAYKYLMALPALEAVELDVTRWNPQPHEQFQRLLILDMHIYCAALRQVVIWVGTQRVQWVLRHDTWVCAHQVARGAHSEQLWRYC